MRNRDQRGAALPTALALSALLVPLGALAVLQARSGLLVAETIRGRAEAHAAAEGAIEWTTASLRSATNGAAILAGPDGQAGTADDGSLPFAVGFVPLPPARASVRVEAAGPNAFRLIADGQGWRGASVTLERLLYRGNHPFSPSAVVTDRPASVSLGSSSFVVDGADHRRGEAIGAGSGSATTLPALCVDDATTEAAVRASLDAVEAPRLRGRGGTPSLDHQTPPDIDGLANRAAARPESARLIAGSLPDDFVAGSSGAPQLTVIDGDASLEGEWSGTGILVVHGRLHVAGRLTFEGVVVATGGVRVEPDAEATVLGALWSSGPAIDLLGSGGIGGCAVCIAAADAAFPDLLPHRLVVGAWREVW